MWSKHGWRGKGGKNEMRLSREAARFLTGTDFGARPKQAFGRSEEAVKSTDGDYVVARSNIMVFGENVTEDSSIFLERDPTKDADREFKAMYDAGSIYPGDDAVFRRLPELSPEMLRDPNYLVEMGLWPRV